MDKQSYGSLVGSPTGKKGKSRLPLVIMFIAIAVAALALLLAVIALGESQREIRNLRNELEELKEILNVTTEVEEDFNTLFAKVDSLSRLQSTANTRLSTLHSTVDTLKTKVNSPRKNCTIKTTNCTMEPATNMTVPTGEFWTGCWTSSLRIHNQADSIQDARCEYVSDDANQVSAILRRKADDVWCECGVTHIDPTTGNLKVVSSLKATCILVTTKCPLSQVARK